MKIKAKLHIAFITTVFLIAVSLMSITYFSMVTHFEQQEGNRLADNVRQSAKAIDNFMFTRVKDLNALSNNPLFGISSSEIISNYLSRVVIQYPFYENILFVNKKGNVISSSDRQFLGVNILNIEDDIVEEFHKTINGGNEDVFISDLAKISQKEIENEAPLDIELLSDVIDLNGNVIGVLIGFVNIEYLREMVFDIDERTIGNEYAYLVNDPGDIIITANPETEILQPHPDLLINDLQQKLEGDENGFLIYVNSNGIKVISGYADLSEYGTEKVGDWSLLSTAPYDEIMSPIYQMLYNSFIACTFISVVIFVIIIFFSRTLTDPLTELQLAVSNFRMNKKPIKLNIGKNDEVGSLCESFNSMTENLHKSFEERKQVENVLKEANVTKDKFFSIIAHDLKSPFNAMLGFSKILDENFDQLEVEKKKRFIGFISKGLQHTFELLENLLDWSSSQTGMIKFNPENSNLYLISENTIELLNQSAKNKFIKLINQIPENIYVNVDKDMISTIMRNLISNAVKFTPQNGEIMIKAQLATYENNKYVEIKVIDNGVGIPEDIKSKLFNIGENPSTDGTENETGTGLGLILCKEFVEKHGGKIWVESEIGEGSEFIFNLPCIV